LFKTAPLTLAEQAYANMQNSQEVQPKALERLIRKLDGIVYDKDVQSMLINAILYTLKPIMSARDHFIISTIYSNDHSFTRADELVDIKMNDKSKWLFGLYYRLVCAQFKPRKELDKQAGAVLGSAFAARLKYDSNRQTSADILSEYFRSVRDDSRHEEVLMTRSDATILSVISRNEYVAERKSFIQIVDGDTEQ
jgi:hypothetical protein